MFNLLDLMRAAQGGAAMENMARQFGLSVDQTRRAMEALMPAFAIGLQRNAGDPMGFSNLVRMMGSGQYARFFDQPGQAFTPWGWSEGQEVLSQLLGPEVSRQVAEQTAVWAGVAPEIMKQMMPVVAATLMGGLSRSAASEGLADMFEQFAKVLRGGDSGARPNTRGRREEQPAMPDPFSAWAAMLGAWRVAKPADKPEPKPQPNEMPDPFSLWASMMAPMMGQRDPAPPPPEAPKEEPPPEPNPLAFFGQIFETGREVQQQHLASLQNIFDTYWSGSKPR